MLNVTDDRPLSQRLREPERVVAPTSLDAAEDGLVVEPECRGEAILRTLADADCRGILSVVGNTALSTDEISEVCDLPTSTTYRKVDTLTDLGLLAEGVRLRGSGHHVREYTRVSENVTVRFAQGEELEIRLFRREDPEYLGTFEPG